jgi:hypothetical protein
VGVFDIWKPGGPPKPAPEQKARLLPAPQAPAEKKKENPFSIWAPKPVAPAPPPPPRPEAGVFQIFAPGAEKPKTFAEAIVPKSEYGSQFEQESEKGVFEMWSEEPSPPPPRPPGPVRTEFREVHRPATAWLDRIFNFGTFWDAVREARRTPKFQAELKRALNPKVQDLAAAEVFEFAEAGDTDRDLQIAWMLGLGWEVVEKALGQGDIVFDDLLLPELRSIEDSLSEIAPGDLPGRFEFGIYDDGSFGLIYFEDPLRSLR